MLDSISEICFLNNYLIAKLVKRKRTIMIQYIEPIAPKKSILCVDYLFLFFFNKRGHSDVATV